MSWRDDWYARLTGATYGQPPRYCTRCNGLMVRVERREGYTSAGVPCIVPGYSCMKNRTWWWRLLSVGIPIHDEVWAATFGDHGYWQEPSYY